MPTGEGRLGGHLSPWFAPDPQVFAFPEEPSGFRAASGQAPDGDAGYN